MQLQRTIGNRAVGKLLSSIGISSTAQQATVQRQEIPEEEEPLQGKFENIQRQEIPEEEETLQEKMIETVQRQEIPEEEEPLQTKTENNTGMPDNLKAGVESLFGIDMSDVKVHYNSDKPAEVGALAYTQGADIHVAPGQERHLPHEAWHVVQQAQGRVKPTMQLKYGVPVNNDKGLEHEADEMGAIDADNDVQKIEAKRTGSKIQHRKSSMTKTSICKNLIQRVSWEDAVKLARRSNVGLRHVRSGPNGQDEIKRGVMGDAVPLIPTMVVHAERKPKGKKGVLSQTRHWIDSTRDFEEINKKGELEQKKILEEFDERIKIFIINEFNTVTFPKAIDVNQDDWKTAISEYIDLLAGEEFLLPSNMIFNGPTDIDNDDYGALGKFGRQQIKANEFLSTTPLKLSNGPEFIENVKLQARIYCLSDDESKECREKIVNDVAGDMAHGLLELINDSLSRGL
ncbi:TPA: DUF4157 domain-containing protein [Methanosarcinaceae archaeon]|nr:DUF4157 domain-containing protein [Methanosarcinaceae archaeon]